MSEPCPPAFIRTAPPTEPGTPTAHSNPVSPAAAVRRASTGSATAAAGDDAPRRRRRRHVERDLGRRGERHGDARRSPRRRPAGSSRARPRAPAARSPHAPRRRERGRRRSRRRRTAPAAPPTRYVVSGASGTSALGAVAPSDRQPRRRRRRAVDRWPRSSAITGSLGATASTSSGSVAMSPQPIEMHTSPARELAGEELDQVVAARAATRHACVGWASSTALTTSLPVTPGIGVRARRVDLGEHHDVGVDERVGVVGPHHGHAVEAVGLEHGDDPLPAVAAVAGRGEHGGDLGRQVGVVVDERGAAVDAADVEAAGDAAELASASAATCERRRRAPIAIAIAPVALRRCGRRAAAARPSPSRVAPPCSTANAERPAVGARRRPRGQSAVGDGP